MRASCALSLSLSLTLWCCASENRSQEEGSRKLSDYLALPPTEYSLLDPKMITRLSDETFRYSRHEVTHAYGQNIKLLLRY